MSISRCSKPACRQITTPHFCVQGRNVKKACRPLEYPMFRATGAAPWCETGRIMGRLRRERGAEYLKGFFPNSGRYQVFRDITVGVIRKTYRAFFLPILDPFLFHKGRQRDNLTNLLLNVMWHSVKCTIFV